MAVVLHVVGAGDSEKSKQPESGAFGLLKSGNVDTTGVRSRSQCGRRRSWLVLTHLPKIHIPNSQARGNTLALLHTHALALGTHLPQFQLMMRMCCGHMNGLDY